jgi:uncharacterized protein (TIGR02391 family)
VLKVLAVLVAHLREVGGDLIVPSSLSRHLGFGQYCDLRDIALFDVAAIEEGIRNKVEAIASGAAMPLALGFEELLDPDVAKAALPYYRMGDYRGAVIKGCDVFVALIRERTGLKLDGVALVDQALKREGALLVVAEGADETARNRRGGLHDLARGAMLALRNVYVHDPQHRPHPATAARHLALLSTLVIQVRAAKRE